MYKLDEVTTRMLIRAIDKLGDNDVCNIQIPDHPILRLQWLDPIRTDEGPGHGFSIGLLLRTIPTTYEVRMVFIIVDRRDPQTGNGPLSAFPLSYFDDANGVSQIAGLVTKGRVSKYNSFTQQHLAVYAKSWLLELETAEYF